MTDSNRGSDQPLVSVVLNSYNTERFISNQIQSILDQTYTNLELIVADDCSTDRTAEIVRQFMHKDPRVKWLQNEYNLGRHYHRAQASCLTFQKGFEIAQGQFIATSDADDFWLPGKIKMQVDYLQAHPEIDLVFTDSTIVSEDMSLKMGSFQKRLGNDGSRNLITMNAVLKRNMVAGHVVLFRRKLLSRIIPISADYFAHDYWTALVAALDAPLGYLRESTVLYRQHAANVAGAKVRNLLFYLGMLNDAAFLQDHFDSKTGEIAGHKKLLTFGGSEVASLKALNEKILNQTAILEVMKARHFPGFIFRLFRAAWTILWTDQKFLFGQLAFLALSWGGIRKLNPQLPVA
jgi:glycosyltransferase involved in cell wall biosynthesis